MNDNALHPSTGNRDGTSLEPLLAALQLLDSGDKGLQQEAAHLIKLLSSPQGFGLFRSVDNEIFLRGSESYGCIGVVSAKGREGRTSISILLSVLAANYARPGKVLLVDATLGGNGPSPYFNLQQAGAGLSDYCIAGKSLVECVHTTALDNLDLVTAGQASSGPAKLSQQGLARFLKEARQQYQFVVVDTPPASQNRDAYSIARLVDAVLLVVRCGYLTREQIQPLVQVLRDHQIPILGSILNRRIFPVPAFLNGK